MPSASKKFVLGDMEEIFHEDVRRLGRRRATRLYLVRAVRMWVAHLLSGGPAEDLSLDLRFALRGLRRNPAFTLVSAATIAVGIGATTAILSIAHAILFRAPPIAATLTVDLRPDPLVLLICLGLTVMTGILFGLGPAVGSARTDLSTTLKEGARGLRLGGKRNHFVVAQLALSTALLLIGGLFVRSFDTMSNVPLGFDPRNVTVATIALGSNEYGPDEQARFYDRLVGEARALPGVESVSLARFVMLGGVNESMSARAQDGDPEESMSVGINVVDPSYFETMRVQLVEGRLFEDRDVAAGAPPVVVVNQTLASRFWPSRSALGRTLKSGANEYRVVGIARDGVYHLIYDGPRPYAFFPYAQGPRGPMSLHVRTVAGAGPIAPEIRRLVRNLDPDVAPSGLRTMDDVVRSNMFGPRILTALASLFSGIGLLLAALGVYGLLAVQVAQQSKELGIRMAMGADSRALVLDVMRRGARFAAIGCAIGALLALAAGRWVGPLLYNVRPLDPVTYAAVPGLLMATVLLASLLPARRAVRVDPTVLLRDE